MKLTANYRVWQKKVACEFFGNFSEMARNFDIKLLRGYQRWSHKIAYAELSLLARDPGNTEQNGATLLENIYHIPTVNKTNFHVSSQLHCNKKAVCTGHR